MSFANVVSETFSTEFMSMVESCLFVPFFHPDTPNPTKVPQSYNVLLDKNAFLPDLDHVKYYLGVRQKLIKDIERAKQALHNEKLAFQRVYVQQNKYAHDNSQFYGQENSAISSDAFHIQNHYSSHFESSKEKFENSIFSDKPKKMEIGELLEQGNKFA